ncbi:MAG: hypothetical protein M3Z18_09850 [Gemmatimonadota bacterium]|nr:hypothetical protein [Gemmatimonadota bacterium]
MERITLRIPMNDAGGPVQQKHISREFQGALPEFESVAFVARIIRDGLETAAYPEYKRLIALPDDWLVQQPGLVTAVPNDVWIRNGFYPVGDWGPASE